MTISDEELCERIETGAQVPWPETSLVQRRTTAYVSNRVRRVYGVGYYTQRLLRFVHAQLLREALRDNSKT